MAEDLSETTSTDWGTQLTDSFVGLVDNVKAKTTGPAITIIRALVFGFLVVAIGAVALILLVAGTVRLVNSYLPGDVWATYLLVGTIFCVGGLILWSKRTG